MSSKQGEREVWTPGPWDVSWVQWPKSAPIGFAIRPVMQPARNEKRGVSIASLNCSEPGITALAVYTQDELEANARLIAAAPALYDALVKAKETIRALNGLGIKGQAEQVYWDIYQHSPEMKEINAALAAATKGTDHE